MARTSARPDARLRLRPCDYATVPSRFGVAPVGFPEALPAGGDEYSRRVAAWQHALALTWTTGGPPRGPETARRWGISTSSLHRYVHGHQWAGQVATVALLWAVQRQHQPGLSA